MRSNQLYHVHADHLGRPEMLTSASGALVWRAENTAFERKVVTSTLGDYNLGFPGQYYDAEGASWQNGFRTYDGSVGRYTQSDPIGLAGGLNTYAYVGGNPVVLTDPTGLDATVCIYPGAVVFGHIGIGINNSVTEGYYPDPAAEDGSAITGTAGLVKADRKESSGCKTIQTSSDADRKMQAFIDQVKSNPGQYDLIGNNCVNFVRQTLSEGGIESPKSILPRIFLRQLDEGSP